MESENFCDGLETPDKKLEFFKQIGQGKESSFVFLKRNMSLNGEKTLNEYAAGCRYVMLFQGKNHQPALVAFFEMLPQKLFFDDVKFKNAFCSNTSRDEQGIVAKLFAMIQVDKSWQPYDVDTKFTAEKFVNEILSIQ